MDKVRPHVFIITIDSLRRDYVSLYGARPGVTPFLDRLAEKSMVFANAYAAGLWTDPAIVSLYTGLYPSQHRILAGTDIRLKKRTLADILSANGYKTVMVGAGSGYISQERFIVRGFESLIDTFDIKRISTYKNVWLNGPKNVELFRGLAYNGIYGKDCRLYYSFNRFKEILRCNNTRPLFVHFHVWFFNEWYSLPWHKKWPYLLKKVPEFNYSSYARLRNKIRQLKSKSIRVDHQYLCNSEYLDEDDLEVIRFLYEASAHYADYRLSLLFRWAEKRGNMNNSIWIITSDHGEMLGEHGLLSHNFSYYQEIIRVPLIVLAPGHLPSRVVSSHVSHVDIPNALLKLLSINETLGQGDHSIFENGFDGDLRDRQIFFEDGRPGPIVKTLKRIEPAIDISQWDYAVKGVISKNWKFIMKSNGQTELFNLSKDAQEQHNVAGQHEDIVRDMSEKIMNKVGDFDYDSPVHL